VDIESDLSDLLEIEKKIALKKKEEDQRKKNEEEKTRKILEEENKRRQKIEEENRSTALCSQPENKRLILFAGHTPNFRETDFDMENESTSAQVKSSEFQNTVPGLFEKQELDRYDLEVKDDDNDDNDDELSEPLGLINAIPQDDSFLAQLTEKLAQEALKSSVVDSSSKCKPTQIDVVESSSLSSSHEDEEAEGSIMKMKSSLNFGRPFGSM